MKHFVSHLPHNVHILLFICTTEMTQTDERNVFFFFIIIFKCCFNEIEPILSPFCQGGGAMKMFLSPKRKGANSCPVPTAHPFQGKMSGSVTGLTQSEASGAGSVTLLVGYSS